MPNAVVAGERKFKPRARWPAGTDSSEDCKASFTRTAYSATRIAQLDMTLEVTGETYKFSTVCEHVALTSTMPGKEQSLLQRKVCQNAALSVPKQEQLAEGDQCPSKSEEYMQEQETFGNTVISTGMELQTAKQPNGGFNSACARMRTLLAALSLVTELAWNSTETYADLHIRVSSGDDLVVYLTTKTAALLTRLLQPLEFPAYSGAM
ncbi:hypothetical protein cyc_07442 [Cyclospora cayetanensis]|uniref:Uncharacterized protein n=1 Tax=Cyclospora cayetanensis TaxID=88456 RepID=A0A1D3D5T1_9EIME|nr:hypothetical protein cyc_07442 [Cyclospora cayetanensis]